MSHLGETIGEYAGDLLDLDQIDPTIMGLIGTPTVNDGTHTLLGLLEENKETLNVFIDA